jgi:NAD(P)-dependent dehydrogenase (short-subunit alcohol dehydrogenase family)
MDGIEAGPAGRTAGVEQRVAIVTGAAEGPKASLGACFARALAREGVAVVLADIADCGAVVEEIESAGGTAVALLTDVSSETPSSRWSLRHKSASAGSTSW